MITVKELALEARVAELERENARLRMDAREPLLRVSREPLPEKEIAVSYPAPPMLNLVGEWMAEPRMYGEGLQLLGKVRSKNGVLGTTQYVSGRELDSNHAIEVLVHLHEVLIRDLVKHYRLDRPSR
jgi:hypothetical protein